MLGAGTPRATPSVLYPILVCQFAPAARRGLASDSPTQMGVRLAPTNRARTGHPSKYLETNPERRTKSEARGRASLFRGTPSLVPRSRNLNSCAALSIVACLHLTDWYTPSIARSGGSVALARFPRFGSLPRPIGWLPVSSRCRLLGGPSSAILILEPGHTSVVELSGSHASARCYASGLTPISPGKCWFDSNQRL